MVRVNLRLSRQDPFSEGGTGGYSVLRTSVLATQCSAFGGSCLSLVAGLSSSGLADFITHGEKIDATPVLNAISYKLKLNIDGDELLMQK